MAWLRETLTDQSIKAYPARPTRYYVADALVSGLLLRISPDGQRRWVVRYRVRGGRDQPQRDYAAGLYPRVSLATARAEARRVLAEAQLGRDPHAERTAVRRAEAAERAAEPVVGLTLDDLASAIFGAGRGKGGRALGARTAKEWRRLYDRQVSPHLGARAVATLDRGSIRRRLETIAIRHTIASGLAELGVDPVVIAVVLAHAAPIRGVTGQYVHHRYATEARAALARWADHLAGLVDLP